MHRTCALQRLISTGHGQRRILKRGTPVAKYIRQAIESGTYPPAEGEPYDDEKARTPPRIPGRLRAKRRTSNALPTRRLAREYLRRQNKQESLTVSDYYERLLGIPPPVLTTAMGRKSAILNKAYAFSIKQFEVMRQDDGITEEESIAIVEELLQKEKKEERFTSRANANKVQQWRNEQKSKPTATRAASKDSWGQESSNQQEDHVDLSTSPSILHSKPRAIQGMAIWSKRLGAVPYKEWTIGATVALDHWIARSVLELDEDTWQELLEGENASLLAHGRDILTVRQSLFPETILDGHEEEHMRIMEDAGDMDEDSSEDKSIDELLASLGQFDSDDKETKDTFWPIETVDDGDLDKTVSALVDDLQAWRAKNVQSPYEQWSSYDKDEFKLWLDKYVTTLASNREGEVDMVATRKALLDSPPLEKDESDKFWDQVRDETEAEILLQSLRKARAPSARPPPEGETGAQRKAREAFAAFQQLPYQVQLEKLVNLGALRPILDEYTKESDRVKFLAQYGEKLMEGVEMEHLVPDPEGPIRGEELGRYADENGIDKDERFRLEMVAYGTDGYGHGQSERAREMYSAWNTQKAGRARFEEIMFKKGRIGLRYNLDKKKERHDR